MAEEQLRAFVEESNRIEGIVREPTTTELKAHEDFLALDRVSVQELQTFVRAVADAELRAHDGMDVRVGRHRPPPGGPYVKERLQALLAAGRSPHETHVTYELLHPFMDGNGRSGRVLWAWDMQTIGQNPFALPFLHRFYYQALDSSRS